MKRKKLKRPMNNEINTDFKPQQTDSRGKNKQLKNSFNGLLPWPLSFSLLCSRIEGVTRYIQGQKATPSMNSIITKQTLEGNMLELWDMGEIRGPPEKMKGFEDYV